MSFLQLGQFRRTFTCRFPSLAICQSSLDDASKELRQVTQKLKEQGHGIGWEMSGAVMGLRQMGQSVSSSVIFVLRVLSSSVLLANTATSHLMDALVLGQAGSGFILLFLVFGPFVSVCCSLLVFHRRISFSFFSQKN
jgi:hypothetical protein